MTDIPSLVERVLLDKEEWRTLRLGEEMKPGDQYEHFKDDWRDVPEENLETVDEDHAPIRRRSELRILATEVTRLQKELQNCNDLCSIEDGGGTVSQVLARKLEKLRAELETERRKVEGLRKELHDVRSVCTEALSRLEETEEVYKPREDANYWRWETTGEGLAGIEWDVTTPLTADALAALTASERGEL